VSCSEKSPWRNPITGTAACCARAANGHAAALPSPAMNCRRRIRHLPSRYGGSLSCACLKGNGVADLALRLSERFCAIRPFDSLPSSLIGITSWNKPRFDWKPEDVAGAHDRTSPIRAEISSLP